MDETYNYYILLSLFSREKPLKANQLATIINGKRTGSTLYQALSNGLLSFFNTFPYLKRDDYASIVQLFLQKDLLIDEGKGYFSLSSQGESAIEQYFANHLYPSHINNARFGNSWQPFLSRLILIIQVMSEYVHQRTTYRPIVQDVHSQYFVKNWVNFHKIDELKVQNFASELENAFAMLNERQAQLIAENLSGYQLIGMTTSDIRKKYQLSKSAYHFVLMDAVQTLLQKISQNGLQFTLLYDIFQRTDYETYHGLSRSTAQSYYLLKKEISVADIAIQRKIKKNTVYDQLIEMAIILEAFPIDSFIDEREKKMINAYLKEATDLSFKLFNQTFPQIPFYKFRLVQVQRLQVI